jgi:hypothetical protein
MKNQVKTHSFVVVLLAMCAAVHAQSIVAVGPVEQVSSDGQSLVVLGQRIALSGSSQIFLNGKKLVSARARELLIPGKLVSVESQELQTGLLGSRVDLLAGTYVPGATSVRIIGRVTKVEASVGRLWIGALEVDYTSVLFDPSVEAIVGSLVEAIGTRPNTSGSVVATGLQSIGGTGQQSIGGTGQQSIGGTGQQSIGGTGQQSIGGTGQQSIGGTGQQSIGGTGQLSIGGTGAQSIGGTGQLSIGGTGRQSIGGTGSQ